MGGVLIYGGTFDPVHNGHLNALNAARELVSPRLTVIIPNRIPPHKQNRGIASGEDRMNMLRLAFGEDGDTLYSDYELTREGKSYSLYTLEYFHSLYPDDELFFVVGSDSLVDFHKWYYYETLLGLCILVCISRQSGDRDSLNDAKAFLEEKGGRVLIADTEPLEVSSSQIREMIRNGEVPSCYLNENVVKYITDHNLYKDDKIDR